MNAFKNFIFKRFELVFVILILLTVSTLVHLIPYKIAFLNFYYIPILMAAFYLGTVQAMLGAALCAIIVGCYVYYFPELFFSQKNNGYDMDVVLQIVIWASFLILSGAVVGSLNKRLQDKITAMTQLGNELDEKNILLEKTTGQLIEYNHEMQEKVAEKTKLLESSKRAIEEHKNKVEQTLYSTMDAAVVKLIIEDRLRTEKRRISILFSDLEGFTSYAEDRGAEIVITDLNAYLQEMEQIVLSYSAHIDKYIGDAVMCEFGAPIHHEHHSLLAVCAGFKMQQKMKARHYPWEMRVGIATGETIIGLIGGNKRQSYSALGDVVNLASRIERLCTAGKVAIDRDTYEHIKGYFNVEQKHIFSFNRTEDTILKRQFKILVTKIEQKADDLSSLRQVCKILLKIHEYEQALDFVKRATEVSPHNQDIKLLYGDIVLKIEEAHEIHVKGRKKSIQIYEIHSLKNPLLMREDIKNSTYLYYITIMDKLSQYPEDLMLPVECQDGSIGHARTVGFFAFVLADMLKLSDQEKHDVLDAAYFSDYGKTIIPHHVLNRHGALSEDEYHEVTKHSRESVRKLKKIGHESEAMLEIVLSHHECIDGSGYPSGLKGDEISLSARIVAVADVYSALTEWRPYRSKWNCQAALNQIKEETTRGKFDVRVVRALEKFIHLNTETNLAK